MTTSRTWSISPQAASNTTRIINRCLETLWIIAIVLIPIAFLGRDQVFSEAAIAYVEVPKVALLRILVALMGVLWLIEWAILSDVDLTPRLNRSSGVFRPSTWLPKLASWPKDHPARWLAIAVWGVLLVTILSTLLSGSRNVSVWGEIPGQDGYSAYSVISYIVLFGVIATHLRTQPQLWRLMGAIILTGVLVGSYGILQHYGRDFLDLTEITGGGTGRVTSFMGNAIFAAALMMLTIPVTLVAATVTLKEPSWTARTPKERRNEWMQALAIAVLWGLVLAVQLLGITFTLSRGPWVGTLVAIVIFLGMSVIFLGWPPLRRGALVLGISGAFAVALLQWQNSISILGLGEWFGVLVGIGGIVGVGIFFANRRVLGRLALIGILAIVLAAGIILGPAWFKEDTDATNGEQSIEASTASELSERFSSIKGEVLGGFISGRGTHWKISWKLIKDRPWFAFDNLSLPWLRPLIGYGPDLFRFTYLLESPPGDDLTPLEPDHAHNYFIHQTVEQGYLGLLSTLGIFAAVFWSGGYQLLRRRHDYSQTHLLILIALLSIVAGKFLEMMVGVARISDLMILWVVLALIVALPSVMQHQEKGVEAEIAQPSPRRRRRERSSATAARSSQQWALIWRLAVVAWLVGGIGVLTWVKGVNNVRAAINVGDAVETFRRGEYQSALGLLERATEVAPDVPSYYNNKASVYRAYLINQNVPQEAYCSTQTEFPYDVCLADLSLQNDLAGADRRPFYYRSRIALAGSAFNLSLNDLVVESYQQSLAMVPNSWIISNQLAQAYLEVGLPESALKVLGRSLAITGDRVDSSEGLMLQGLAYSDLGRAQEAVKALTKSAELNSSQAGHRGLYGILGETYTGLNQFEGAGDAHYQQGASDFEAEKFTEAAESYDLSGEAYEKSGMPQAAGESFYQTGEIHQLREEPDAAARSFERSLELFTVGLLYGAFSVFMGCGELIKETHRQLTGIYETLGKESLAAEHRKFWQPYSAAFEIGRRRIACHN